MFEVSADLTSEILTERCSGKQVCWNCYSKPRIPGKYPGVFTSYPAT